VRRIRTLIVVSAATALLGACSGSFSNNSEPASGSWPRLERSGVPGDTVRRIAGSTDTTAAERTARFAFSVDGAGDGERATIAAEGAIDFVSQNLSMRIDVGGFGFGDPVDGSTEVRIVDGVFYVDLGDLGDSASELPAGTRWLQLDLGGLIDALGGSDALTESANPLDGLQALRGVSSDVEEVGTEELRGVETTHYRATLDLATALADAPADMRDRAQDLLDRAGEARMPVDVWLDAQDRVRKYTLSFENASLGESSDASVAVTYELYDFGAAVEVGAPPADEVADLGSMFGELFDGFLDGFTGRSNNPV
jgi:hypothetical protein